MMPFSILLGMAVKGALVLAFALAVVASMRRSSAAARHAVLVLALGGALVWPALEVLVPRAEPPSRIVAWVEPARSMVIAASSGPAAIAWRDWAVGLWAAGAVGLMLRLAVARFLVERLARRTTPCPDAGAEVLESQDAAVPFAFGVLGPRIVLPAEWRAWSADKRRAVLLHERAHIERRDNLAILVGHLACAVHWFNPLAWLALRRQEAEQEKACDDLVLNQGIRASDYAGHLVEMGRAARNPATVSMAASPLKPRIESILAVGTRRTPLRPWQAALALACVACVALPLAAMRPQGGASAILGNVTAGAGGIAGAEVNALHVRTRQKFVAKTDSRGAFELRGLPDGNYEIYVLAEGYAIPSLGTAVRAGENLLIDPVLRPSEAEGRTEVRAKPQDGRPTRTRMGGNVQPARLITRVAPEYPEVARAAGAHGPVSIRAVIRMDGGLGGLTVVSSPHPALSDAALQALSQWRFEPSRLNGQPLETVTNIAMEFELTEK